MNIPEKLATYFREVRENWFISTKTQGIRTEKPELRCVASAFFVCKPPSCGGGTFGRGRVVDGTPKVASITDPHTGPQATTHTLWVFVWKRLGGRHLWREHFQKGVDEVWRVLSEGRAAFPFLCTTPHRAQATRQKVENWKENRCTFEQFKEDLGKKESGFIAHRCNP